jgi:hypothetical protein
LDTESGIKHWEWLLPDSEAAVNRRAASEYIGAPSAGSITSPAPFQKGGNMPPFKRGDIVEYVEGPHSIPSRVGSIAIVRGWNTYHGLEINWVMPTWNHDAPGDREDGITPTVFRKLTHASL